MVTEQSIREAYIFLRQNNNTIPDETLEFMLDASLQELERIRIREKGLTKADSRKILSDYRKSLE